jgi:iron complex outermembrane recepter protein
MSTVYRGAAGALAAVWMTAPGVHAETGSAGSEQIEEIVVTAQKREQNLQRIPISVTAVTGDSLQARGITDVSSFAEATSGLQLGQGTAGVVVPFLRGVGTSATNLGAESSVAVYADGVYFSRLPAGFFSLNDVERVEVLKGPQFQRGSHPDHHQGPVPNADGEWQCQLWRLQYGAVQLLCGYRHQ